MMRELVWVAVMLCLSCQVAVAEIRESGTEATAAAASSESTWSDAGYGTLAVVANVFYMPVKIVYASVGLVTGGLAYVLTVGDDDAAKTIWSPSLGGTYVVTSAMLRNDEPILFSGASHSKN
jgi:hypothetical protein